VTSSLINRLASRITFPPAGTAVACAVSGGPDSLALLALATHAGLDVTAVHVDHGLRPGSADEASVVEAAAAQFGAAFQSERVDVPAGPNLEARARAARYAVLPADVLTGHTADDQAETVLLNLLRGAGLAGLAGMAPERHPLLGLRRVETHALCADLGLCPVRDPSNNDPAWRRNRVRHEVLPFLSEVAGRDLVPVLTRQAVLLRDEAALLDSLAAELDPADAHVLARAPLALARRAIRIWLHDGEHPPDAATVERVLAVARMEAEGCEIGNGRSVRRSGGRMRLEGR
jgi:tRNA(Ile)-lysidine synthase